MKETKKQNSPIVVQAPTKYYVDIFMSQFRICRHKGKIVARSPVYGSTSAAKRAGRALAKEFGWDFLV